MSATIGSTQTIDVHNAVIEYVYESGILASVTVHQPMFLPKENIQAIHDEIECRVPDNCEMQEMPPRLKGRVHILEWKVIYE